MTALKACVCVVIITFYCMFITECTHKDHCLCTHPSKCPSFRKLNYETQKKWLLQYPCQRSRSGIQFNFKNSSVFSNYICCEELESYVKHRKVKRQVNQHIPVPNNQESINFQNNFNNHNNGDNFPLDGTRSVNQYDNNQNFYPAANNNNNGNGSPLFNGNIPPHNERPMPPPVQANQHIPGNSYADLNAAGVDNAHTRGKTNYNDGCRALTSFPPKPETGCCGMDASETNGIDVVKLTTGGKTTELEQYPWAVLLMTKYDFGTRKATFNCGGSVISSRYVLTAAHCVMEEGARVIDIEIYLAEFDKRTFPVDCVSRPEGNQCVTNIVMHPEEIITHPEFDESRLQNDIALIRVNGNIPYTKYIRPICLPPVDIDSPDLSNLRLSVAGWGRNGKFNSDIKQSTVVNLVPQRECKKFYPHLTRRHLCAAGYTGEDTCKGDSGGPLMMAYQGKYYVSGVVSGKRADSPCGTSVPSLYTNVYHYLDWIGLNIRN